ncbi:hypothetical protein SDC9_157515 [bioreactor metagenome]|uniref:Uncharacterized protein n=1 Tax=bioreactor metagenome TaxID=1076179 RepID=A0A645F8I4_9ZZZZ
MIKNNRTCGFGPCWEDGPFLEGVMNIFLQKRGKFENLAFTYGTF